MSSAAAAAPVEAAPSMCGDEGGSELSVWAGNPKLYSNTDASCILDKN